MKKREVDLEKFYTKPNIAERCCSHFDFNGFDLIIEPSAGNGSFLGFLPKEKTKAYDIEPEAKGIIKQDFLDLKIDKGNRRILTIGNPPFGRQSSLAIKFINHAAEYSDLIGFVLPNSFFKESMQNKLNPNVWLSFATTLEDRNLFHYDGKEYNIPCSFFIFEVRQEAREKPEELFTEDFEFVKKNDADFSIRRVGKNAGRVEGLDVSEESHYFIKDNNDAVNILRNMAYSDADNTVGPRSLSKKEIVREYLSYKENIEKIIAMAGKGA